MEESLQIVLTSIKDAKDELWKELSMLSSNVNRMAIDVGVLKANESKILTLEADVKRHDGWINAFHAKNTRDNEDRQNRVNWTQLIAVVIATMTALAIFFLAMTLLGRLK